MLRHNQARRNMSPYIISPELEVLLHEIHDKGHDLKSYRWFREFDTLEGPGWRQRWRPLFERPFPWVPHFLAAAWHAANAGAGGDESLVRPSLEPIARYEIEPDPAPDARDPLPPVTLPVTPGARYAPQGVGAGSCVSALESMGWLHRNTHTGAIWDPRDGKPAPSWVHTMGDEESLCRLSLDSSEQAEASLFDKTLASLRFQEPEEAQRPLLEGKVEQIETPVFDEPAGECRKSAESATKTRFDLVPWEAVEEITQVLAFGARKYGDSNWCRGARWGRYFAALCRHIFAWWGGENKDPETGFSHLAHACCCLIFLIVYQRNGWGDDDRFTGPDDKGFVKHDNVDASAKTGA
jgi:hypothetical protein